MQSGQKAKMRDSTPLSYSISPRFSKSTMQRTIAVFVSLTTGERLSQQILCFSHTLSFSHIFQFSNPFLPIASKGKGGELSNSNSNTTQTNKHRRVHSCAHFTEHFNFVDKAQKELDSKK